MKRLQTVVIILAIVVATFGLLVLQSNHATANINTCKNITCPGAGDSASCFQYYRCGQTCTDPKTGQQEWILPLACCPNQPGAYCQW